MEGWENGRTQIRGEMSEREREKELNCKFIAYLSRFLLIIFFFLRKKKIIVNLIWSTKVIGRTEKYKNNVERNVVSEEHKTKNTTVL